MAFFARPFFGFFHVFPSQASLLLSATNNYALGTFWSLGDIMYYTKDIYSRIFKNRPANMKKRKTKQKTKK
ncbi:uncharacterized protein GGS25DRAFT_507579 [Hypoxylon fragiforme]|uniref:uncharacterized protein n=1 Tax=Hypoxylon fragiforme TaxID=63214 RepID=UPI0020C5F3BE|nr:uncharacterized protein GGS25DRAFT_507579 [Hypoxylon fragiforme]KAI2604272.1 hypothetical protein GGS25DRAFT_507579 [Hypoxylon fragiforme]